MIRRFSLPSLFKSLFLKPRTKKAPLSRRTKLAFDYLEDRIVPDNRNIGGLEFYSPTANFAADGSISSEVQVGFATTDPTKVVALLTLPGGVKVDTVANKATVNATLKAGGMTFTGTNLTFAADVANNTYTATGDASVTVGTTTISVGLGTAGTNTAGLVLANGALSKIDAAVTSAFTVGGLNFQTKSLKFGYVDATQKYTMTGDASVAFKGNTLNVTLGGTGTTGLVITNGALTSFDTTVTSDVTLGGLTLQAKSLKFGYVDATQTYTMTGDASVAFKGNTLNVTLGGTGTTGLVITNGALTSLDTTVTSDVTLGSLTLQAKSLKFTYTDATSTFTLSGDATVAAAGNTITVSLGAGGTAGMVVTNGTLTSLDASVTSTLTFSSVTFTTKDLRITYDVADGTKYTITGDASVAFTGAGQNAVNATVHFGEVGNQKTPGLVIVNGKLQKLYVALTGTFSLAGLTISADQLGFSYVAASGDFGMYGTAKISTADQGGKKVLDNFGVTFGQVDAQGDPSTPGVLIKAGTLEKIDVTLNGSFTLAALTVTPKEMRVEYTKSTGILQFTGELTVSLTASFNGSVKLLDGGLKIDTTTGAVSLGGFRVQISDTKIGPIGIREAFVQLTNNTTTGNVDVSGGATVDLPAGLSVGGTFNVVNGQLRQISIDFTKDPGIALGATGVFVNRVKVDVNNIDNPDQLQLTGLVGLTAGPSFTIDGSSKAFASGTLQVSLDQGAGQLKFAGEVSLLGGLIPVGNGNLTITYDRTSLQPLGVSANVTMDLYGGFLHTQFSFNLAPNGDIDASALAELRTPDFLTFNIGDLSIKLGGITLGSFNVSLHYLAADPGNTVISFGGKIDIGIADFSGNVAFNLHGDVRVKYHYSTLFGLISGDGDKSFPKALTDFFPGSPSAPLALEADHLTFTPTERAPIAPLGDTATPASPPLGYKTTAKIDSVTRVASTPDALVTYEGTALNPGATKVLVGVYLDQGPNLPPLLVQNIASVPLVAGQQTIKIPNADQYTEEGSNLVVGIKVEDDGFTTPVVSDPVFSALPTRAAPQLSITAPTGVTFDPSTPFTFASGAVQIGDTSSTLYPTAKVNVFLHVDAGVLKVPTLPASVTDAGSNGTGDMMLTGTAADINALLNQLTYTPDPFSPGDDSLTIGIDRAPIDLDYSEKVVALTVNPVVLKLQEPPAYTQGAAAVAPLTGASLANSTAEFFSGCTVAITNYAAGADKFLADLPDGSPLTPYFDAFKGVLTLTGTGTAEDYTGALESLKLQSFDNNTTKVLDVTIADTLGHLDKATATMNVTVTGAKQTPFTFTDDQLPRIIAGIGACVYTGTAVPINPNLTAEYTGTKPLSGASIKFNAEFDETADTLTFTAQNGITGTYDKPTGVLTLSGQATVAQYEQALRSVAYKSLRANPEDYEREILFTLTNGTDTSKDDVAQSIVHLEVAGTPPVITAVNAPLTLPQGSAPAQVFTNFTLANPDAALPTPPEVLGSFAPGTKLFSASVGIDTNYVQGEDLLTFTTTGNITGQFFPDTGELILTGEDTLANYQQVIQSIKYQNVNPVPSTASRSISVTLDDGEPGGKPASAARTILPQSNGARPVQSGGTVSPLSVATGAAQTSLGLAGLAYTPAPGETDLLYTIKEIPQGNQGKVVLTDGTDAQVGKTVTLAQLTGAVFVPASPPIAGTSPFTFTITGKNPITNTPDPNPLVASIPITTQDAAPVAGADTATGAIASPVTINVLANDSDANKDNLSIKSFSTPSNGTVALNADGTRLIYTPTNTGPDSFTYTVDDGRGGSTTATVSLTNGAGPNGTIANMTPQFGWSTAAGVNSNEIYISDLTDGTIVDQMVTANKFTPQTPLTSGHSYRWWFKPENGDWSDPLDFTVALPGLLGPTGSLSSVTPPTFSWNGVAGAAQYEVYVSDEATGLWADQTVTATSWTPTQPLLSGHKYDWWVRALDNAGNGVWGDFKVFAVGLPILTNPSGPVNNVAPQYSWTGVAGVNQYEVYVLDKTTGAVTDLPVTGTTYTPVQPLQSGHTYTWWVRGLDNAGNGGAWTDGKDFTVALPILNSPTGSLTNVMPTFTWTGVTGVTQYEVYVNDSATGLWSDQTVTGTSWTPTSPLFAGHSYTWWVRALDSAGGGVWTNGVDFNVGLPTLTAPSGTVSNTAMPFTWTGLTGVSKYEVYVIDQATGLWADEKVTGTSWTPTTPLTSGHSYLWWVLALQNDGSAGGNWTDPAVTFQVS